MDKRRMLRDLVIVFLLALLTRLTLALWLPSGDTVFWDESYWEYARNMAEGRGFWMRNPYGHGLGLDRVYAFRPPLFPFLWGCVFRLTGGAYAPIRAVHAVLGAAACALAYLAGLELVGKRKTALLGGILCALYPPLIWHSVHLMTEPLFIFFSTLLICALLKFRRGGALGWLIVSGLAAGLGVLSRSVLVGFVPVAAIWLWWVRGRHLRAVREAGIFAGIVLLAMSPWMVRNAIVLRAFVPTTTDAGHGFHVANNPDVGADGSRRFAMPKSWAFIKEPGETSVGEVEANRRLFRRTFKYLMSHPADALRLMGRRFVALWRFCPDPRHVPWNRGIAYLLSYVPLFPFMLFGLWTAHRRGGDRFANVILVDLLVLYTTCIHTLFLAMMRYRVPLMPFLLAFAALGIWNVVEALSEFVKRRTKRAAGRG